MNEIADGYESRRVRRHLARVALFVFLVTFTAARALVFLIMSRRVPDLFLFLGGTHVHHLNYGIFLLAAVGGYLLLFPPEERSFDAVAILYGVGLALTFDEFGMWLHLGGSYWQRASFDAISVVAALLALIAFAPAARTLRAKHYTALGVALAARAVFFLLLVESFGYATKHRGPHLETIERTWPR
ncbi:MAG: hypothetical protein V2A58_03800 [Planctomycetota bacterium]